MTSRYIPLMSNYFECTQPLSPPPIQIFSDVPINSKGIVSYTLPYQYIRYDGWVAVQQFLQGNLK
jgi:hypothetical protein